MMRLIYTPRSLDDFDRILERISQDDPRASVRLGEALLKTCELLESNPLLGEAQHDLFPGLRRFVCRGYAIYYTVEEAEQTVFIVRFLPPRLNITPELFH